VQGLVVRWLTSALALWLTSLVVRGVHFDGVMALLFAAVTIGILNAVIRPILLVLTLPLNILTLGLFTFVVNGLMLKIASDVVKGFTIDGMWSAIAAALLMSFFSFLINLLVGDSGNIEVVRIRTLSFRH
jgi:putative membrane protein